MEILNLSSRVEKYFGVSAAKKEIGDVCTQAKLTAQHVIFTCEDIMFSRESSLGISLANTVERRFNEVPRDWGHLFVISRVPYIENLI